MQLPVHAHWFRMDSTDELERRFLPDFFTTKIPSKTPESYKEMRNFMVEKYREDVRKWGGAGLHWMMGLAGRS